MWRWSAAISSRSTWRDSTVEALLGGVSTLVAAAALLLGAPASADTPPATTPIQHLIVVVGENLSFDNLFGIYEPRPGTAVHNLLSEEIANRDGSPGPNFARAAQRRAEVHDLYEVTPRIVGTYGVLPRPGTTYAVGLPRNVPDQRFPELLPNGPFPITKYVDYAKPVGDPVHRFFQMWQQVHGGQRDLFVWVAETSGEGSQNRDDPASSTNQGAVAMGFYNMAAGDAAYFRELADTYALSDNHHQPVMGGTGANFQALATGHAIAYWEGGALAKPPPNQIENPNPRPGTNNWYAQSGYSSGSYTKCSDPSEPGIAAIHGYLMALPYPSFNGGNCEPGAYYLVNNYNAGFLPTGKPAPLGPKVPRIPPQAEPTIAEALSRRGVSWKWYSGGRNGAGTTGEYCPVCDPLIFSSAIMTGPLKSNLQGHDALFRDIDNGDMPAVAFVIPPNSESGHPASSTVSLFEQFLRRLIGKVQSNRALWEKTAILVTVDESGGYWDSGYIQALDAFGDGTRIPLIAVSPFAKKGAVDHTYTDHVSILKFIEANWRLDRLSARSRDHLPNPVADPSDPYVPANRPAIGDLENLFAF
jgi:phospholipase C